MSHLDDRLASDPVRVRANVSSVVPRRRRWKAIGLGIVVFGLVADLWSKHAMQGLLGMSPDRPHGSLYRIEVIDGLLAWAGNWNAGVTFGMAAGLGEPILWFTMLAGFGILAWLLVTRSQSRVLHVALAMILSGALGNLYDRWRFGMVRDFIDVYWKDHHWHTFNVADSLIVVGVSLILWLELFGRHGAATAAPRAGPP